MTNSFEESFENDFNFDLKKYIEKYGLYYSELQLNYEESKDLLKHIHIPLKQMNDGSDIEFHFEFYNKRIFLSNGKTIIPCSSIIKTVHGNYLITPYIIPSGNKDIYLNTFYFDERVIQLIHNLVFYINLVKSLTDIETKNKFIIELNKFWIKSEEDSDKSKIIRIVIEGYSELENRLKLFILLDCLGFFSMLILYKLNYIEFERDKFFEIFFDEYKEIRFNINFSFSKFTLNITSLNDFVLFVKNKLGFKEVLLEFFEIDCFLKGVTEITPTTTQTIYELICKIDKGIDSNFPSYEQWLNSENRYGNYTVLRNLDKLTNSINFKNIQYRNTPKEVKEKHLFVQKYCQKINNKLRVVENEYRIEKGYNIVGSLISETILYKKIKEYFINYNVVSQGSPNWLKPQRLDVYFPDFNIGIEYQGDQHFRPVDYFGGEEGFRKTIERDIKKRNLCRRNGCVLIEVLPSYNFDNLVNEIAMSIEKIKKT